MPVAIDPNLVPARKRDAHYNRAARIHAAFHREIDKLVAAGLAGTSAQIERLIAAPSRYVSASAALERILGLEAKNGRGTPERFDQTRNPARRRVLTPGRPSAIN